MLKILLGILATLFFAPVNAFSATAAAINKSSCGSLVHTTSPFVLVLDSGDVLHDSISQCAKDAKLLGASLSGLGQVHNPTMAYFSSNPTDKPTLKRFGGFYELASLNGNITNNDGKYYTHLHVVLADKRFHAIAGHLDTATAGLTVEVTITPLAHPLQRTLNPNTGFGPIVH